MMDAILLLRKMQATNNLKTFKVGGCSKQPQKGAATYVRIRGNWQSNFKHKHTNPFSGKIGLLTPLNDEIL